MQLISRMMIYVVNKRLNGRRSCADQSPKLSLSRRMWRALGRTRRMAECIMSVKKRATRSAALLDASSFVGMCRQSDYLLGINRLSGGPLVTISPSLVISLTTYS